MSLFVRPCELITFLTIVNHIGRQLITQFVEINPKHNPAVFVLMLSHTLRKQLRNLLNIRASNIKAPHLQPIHHFTRLI